MSLRMIRLAGAVTLSLVTASVTGAQMYTVPPTPVAPVSPPSPISVRGMTPAEFRDTYGFEYQAAVAPGGLERGSMFGPAQQRYPQDPADSLYREARQLLNRGEWRKAAALFARVADHRPPSAYAADALYWQAFMLYRIGGTGELRQALVALDSRKSKYPNARSETEAATLATRIRGALASRGDRTAEAALARDAAAGSAGCDEEELSVRSSALSALQRSDPEAAQALLTRVLDRKDECSVSLRKNAVMMIGTKGDAAAKSKLASVVRSDPSLEVRAEALSYLAKTSGEEVVPTLEAVIRSDEDDRLRRSAVRALGSHESARARAALRALVERTEAPEALRLEALSTFDRGAGYNFVSSYACSGEDCTATAFSPRPPTPAVAPRPAVTPRPAAAPRPAQVSGGAPRPSEREAAAVHAASASSVFTLDGSQWSTSSERRISPEDATWLRNVYPRLETQRLRARAVSVLSRSGDEATLSWLMNLVQAEDEPADIRATVLSRLGRDLPISSLNRLFDNASNRTVRQQIVSTLGERKEPEATDKLLDIVRTNTDPQLRRSAMNALTRKNDPRTTKLLMELIDK